MKKLIINVRVNEWAMRNGNPNVPWTTAEIGRDVRFIREADASVIHFDAHGDVRELGQFRAGATDQCQSGAGIRADGAGSDAMAQSPQEFARCSDFDDLQPASVRET